MNESARKIDTRTIVTIGMLCAIAFAAKCLSKAIPVSVAGFLEFDLKDVVIVIAGFICGPLPAAAVALVVSLIEMISISDTGFIGLIMNVLSSCAFACTAAALYQRNRTMKGAVVALTAGVVCMAAVMLLWNYLITPLYMKVERSRVVGMLVPVFLPFNLLKGGINATLAMLLYKPLVNALRRSRLVPPSASAHARGLHWGVALVSLALFVTFALLALVLAGVL